LPQPLGRVSKRQAAASGFLDFCFFLSNIFATQGKGGEGQKARGMGGGEVTLFRLPPLKIVQKAALLKTSEGVLDSLLNKIQEISV